MSYGLMLFAVNKSSLFGLEGSQNQALFDLIVQRCRQTIDDNTSWFDYIDGLLTLDQALHHVVFGEPKRGDSGFQYGYALKMTCSALGRQLDNGAFYPMDLEWGTEQLANAGVDSVELEDLSYGILRMWDVPLPNDFPGYGYWPEEKIDALRKELEHAKPPEGADPWIHDALDEMRHWVNVVGDDEIIVGFYH